MSSEQLKSASGIDARQRSAYPKFANESSSSRADLTLPLIHELFSAQAKKTPEAFALIFRRQRLTYAELDDRSQCLADLLVRQGVGPESIVGVFIDRSFEMVVAVLGILKAGGAYLPLDITMPAERIAFMIKDAGTSLVLTRTKLATRVPTGNAAVVTLDRDVTETPNRNTSSPGPSPDNLAYVIYTSGSAGLPKGVMLTHNGLANYLNWCTAAYRVAEGSGSVVQSPLTFDLTITSLLAPLVCGRKVMLLPDGADVETLADVLNENGGYSLLKITPSHVEGLGYALKPETAAQSTNALIIGGEALHGENLAFWRETAPDVRIINEYGPTETVVGCCVYEIAAGDITPGRVPIGQAIANTVLYVLDENMRRVEPGFAGELYIGGAGVARGYLNRPDLTAEKFVPDPFGTASGARLYRSGDRVREIADSNLEYLGRLDEQVKIRGYRVELGEIEAVLRQRSEVADAIVLLRENEASTPQLIAYLVPARAKVAIEEVRDALAKKLPAQMIPSRFILMDQWPLTPNGKVDRRALPDPEDSRPQLADAYLEPRDETETQLTQVFEGVLGTTPIGVRDDFFALGGNSLLAVRVFSEIAKRFGRKLPLATLFEASTIEKLANVLRSDSQPSWSSLVPIKISGSRKPLFCLHSCGPHVFHYRALVDHLDADQPVFGIQTRGIDGSCEPSTSVTEMAAHYATEIRHCQPDGPYQLLGETLGGIFAFEVARALERLGQEVSFLGLIDTMCPLPLSIWRRGLCHLIHIRKRGPIAYFAAAARAVKNRVTGRSSRGARSVYAVDEVIDIVEKTNATEGTLARIEAAVLLAVFVNYSPPKEGFSGKLTYFYARDNEFTVRWEDNRRDWRKLARGGMDLIVLPGGHNDLREEPHVQLLAKKLTAALAK